MKRGLLCCLVRGFLLAQGNGLGATEQAVHRLSWQSWLGCIGSPRGLALGLSVWIAQGDPQASSEEGADVPP